MKGGHLVGKILMENCPVLIKDKMIREEKIKAGVIPKQYCEDQAEDQQIKHEIQLHCLRVLRFLYSV